MEKLALEVTPRTGSGKGAARKLRAQGLVPGIVYGRGLDPIPVQMAERPMRKIRTMSGNSLIELSGVEGVQGKLVLVKEAQLDPATRELVHCDFFVVDTSKRIHVSIPVRLEGKPHGVEMGGVLEPMLREVEVSCLPLTIPEAFVVDVSQLDIGDSVRAADLTIPEGVELLIEESVGIVHVIAPRLEVEPTEEELAEGEEAPAEEGATPEEAAAETEGSGD